MKKVILCLLLLIPILVILTIDASGLLIASAMVDIPAESVVIKHGGEVIESAEVNLDDYVDIETMEPKGKRYNLFCEVFPGIATDEMIWESTDERIATIEKDASRKDAAEVKFHDYGSVDIVCTSKKNSSISARATLYINGNTPKNLFICDFEGEAYEQIEVARYGEIGLLASVQPSNAAKGQKIQWSVEDLSVAVVDNNGVLRGVSKGETTVTATVTVKGKKVFRTLPVTVGDGAMLKQKVVYSAADSIDITPYLSSGSAIEGNVISLAEMAPFEEKEVLVCKGKEEERLLVVKIPDENTLLVENYYALREGIFKHYVTLGSSNYELNVILPDGSTPVGKIKWESTNSDVVEMRDNRLYAVGIGKAEIYPKVDGYSSVQRITINVIEAVEDFRLSETVYADAVGLRQERVFGNQTYKNGEYTYTYPLKIASSFPSGVRRAAFSFKSMDESVATVDETGLITFAKEVEGKAVEIVVTAYNQVGTPVIKEYTFHMVEGVNVGTGVPTAHFDKAAGETPDFTPYWDLKTVAANRSVKSIVLHTDVYFASKQSGATSIMNATASFYGNGKKLDGQFFIGSVEDSEMLLMWDFSTFKDMPETLDIKIVNMNMQATQPTSDDAKTAFTELSERGGGAIGAKNPYPAGEHSFSLTVVGALFQYAYGHVNVSIGDFSFDGCIFRNNSASSIVQQQQPYGVANVKIKNCIFSNTIAPVAIACGSFDSVLARFKSGKPESAQFGKFEVEGKNYVYNWKKLDEIQMSLLPRSLDDASANALVEYFNGYLGRVIRESFMSSDKGTLYVDENGEEWLNFSFLMIGVWDNMNPQINLPDSTEQGIQVVFDTDRYQCFEVHAEKAASIPDALKRIIKSIGVDLKRNKTYHIVAKDEEGNFNTKPGETYTIDKEIYRKLRGE